MPGLRTEFRRIVGNGPGLRGTVQQVMEGDERGSDLGWGYLFPLDLERWYSRMRNRFPFCVTIERGAMWLIPWSRAVPARVPGLTGVQYCLWGVCLGGGQP